VRRFIRLINMKACGFKIVNQYMFVQSIVSMKDSFKVIAVTAFLKFFLETETPIFSFDRHLTNQNGKPIATDI
jgi:hypothetical protein